MYALGTAAPEQSNPVSRSLPVRLRNILPNVTITGPELGALLMGLAQRVPASLNRSRLKSRGASGVLAGIFASADANRGVAGTEAAPPRPGARPRPDGTRVSALSALRTANSWIVLFDVRPDYRLSENCILS